MKTVLLLRHGKSDWSGMGQSDKERPLSPRGLKAASRMGAYIEASGHAPELVICSPARRAEQTCALAVDALGTAPDVIVNNALYDFSGEAAYLEAIQTAPDDVERLMLVGHNPTTYHLADMLTGSGKSEFRADLAVKFPTAALAILTFDVDTWQGVAPGQGMLADFTKPRDLRT